MKILKKLKVNYLNQKNYKPNHKQKQKWKNISWEAKYVFRKMRRTDNNMKDKEKQKQRRTSGTKERKAIPSNKKEKENSYKQTKQAT